MVQAVLPAHIKSMNMWMMTRNASIAARGLMEVVVLIVRRANIDMAQAIVSVGGVVLNPTGADVRIHRIGVMKSEDLYRSDGLEIIGRGSGRSLAFDARILSEA